MTLSATDIVAGRTFIDVSYFPSTTRDLDPTSIDGNEFALSGFGGTGVSIVGGGVKVVQVGTNIWRYMLDSLFRPGEVIVNFRQNTWNDRARGPPAGATFTPNNRAFDQVFSVAGATADLTRTVTATEHLQGDRRADDRPRRDQPARLHRGHLPAELRLRDRPHDDQRRRDRAPRRAGNLVALSGALTRVGLTDTYRYGLAGQLANGKYTVNFVGGSFADTGGQNNQEEIEELHARRRHRRARRPDARDRARPRRARGPRLDRRDLHALRHGNARPDDDHRLRRRDHAHQRRLDARRRRPRGLLGRQPVPLLLHGLRPHRRADHRDASTPAAGRTSRASRSPQAQIAGRARRRSLSAALQDRIWLDVRFKPVGSAEVDASTIDGNEITLTGAGSENLAERRRHAASRERPGATCSRASSTPARSRSSFLAGDVERQGRQPGQAGRASSRSSRRRRRSSSSSRAASSSPPADTKLMEAKARSRSRSTPRARPSSSPSPASCG